MRRKHGGLIVCSTSLVIVSSGLGQSSFSQCQPHCSWLPLRFVRVLIRKPRAASNTVTATFVGQGPGPINDPDNGRVTGAIKSVVPHPTNPDIVWAGSVNGGVWKTTNATSNSPSWTPLTDHMPSLSIGALALDPTYSSNDVLVAGAGHWSAYGSFTNERVGGPLTGIIRTTDGGATWIACLAQSILGEDLSGVAARAFRDSRHVEASEVFGEAPTPALRSNACQAGVPRVCPLVWRTI